MAYSNNITSQHKAARIAGLSILLLIISGLVSNLFISSGIIVNADVEKTAKNIIANEKLFRVGIVCSLIMFNCDIIEAIALYVLLKPVNKTLALLGVFWRFANACIGSCLLLGSFLAIHLASNSDYMATLSSTQSHSLMMLFLNPENDGGLICLTFFSLGMLVHGYLLFKSKYIPRILSSFYVFASLLLLFCSFALLIFPNISKVISSAWILPDFVAELLVGLWLSIKGVRIPEIKS